MVDRLMLRAIAAKSMLLMLLFLAGTLTPLQAQPERVEVSLDRSELVRGETVVLTIRVYGQQGGIQMDMTPLREKFDIILTRTSTQLRTVNNITEAWTDYHLTLFPLEVGEIEIPSLEVAGFTTEPLTINVLPQTQNGMVPGQSIYMETVLNKESVYVQEQVLFTIRLYYTINGIRNPQFTELEMPDSVIQMIGAPNQYEKLIDGQRYGVYEKHYVIFPQRSGTMVIPDIIFRGEVTDGSSSFVFRNMNTRTITAFSEGYSVEVKERPDTFPSETWLPAADIRIEETWSGDPTQLRVGDSITRTVSITANGLDGAALPPLQRTEIDRLNIYPEPSEIERTFVDGNIVGSRIETSDLVAVEAGSIVIPEISLPWWDVDTEELKYATLAESYLVVAPAPNAEPAVTPEAPAQPSVASDPAGNTPGSMIEDDLITTATPPAWILVLAAALAGLIIFAWYLLPRRRQREKAEKKAPPPRSAAYAQEIAANQEAQAYRQLEKTCQGKDPAQIRLSLIAWGRQFYQDAELLTLDDLQEKSGSSDLQQCLLRIQAAAYSCTASSDSELAAAIDQLLQQIRALRQQRKNDAAQHRDDDYVLPPLYKM